MTAADNKALLRRVFEEALNAGNLAVVDEVFSMHFKDHSTPEQVSGPQGVREYFAAVRHAFPDMLVTIADMLAEADKIAVRTTWRGTHLAKYEGIEPTGKQVARTMIQIFRVEKGKIVEEWNEGQGLQAQLRA